MRNIVRIVLGSAIFVACNKPDEKAPDISDKLNNRYCNIPQAVNFNHGFPGIEDNSICEFATTYYLGDWRVVDTVKKSDSTIVSIDTLILSFSNQLQDTSYSLMNMKGWCNNETILMHFDKYYFGKSDTFYNEEGWQKICNADSILVNVKKDIYDTAAISINIIASKQNEYYYHIAKGTKL